MSRIVFGVRRLDDRWDVQALAQALQIDGVEHVRAQLEPETLTVDYDHQRTNQTQIALAISSLGWEPYVVSAEGDLGTNRFPVNAVQPSTGEADPG